MPQRTVSYGNGDSEIDGATFVLKCPTCGRFVQADQSMHFKGIKPVEPNATCRKCGRVAMPFIGFI